MFKDCFFLINHFKRFIIFYSTKKKEARKFDNYQFSGISIKSTGKFFCCIHKLNKKTQYIIVIRYST